ncbi:MAG: hypothetical protein JSV66_13930 [Trueperaceae bacterium]|nr:MAG: hypothetical protein JSV66_13930 [Trueperaceae bacterium]
MRKLVLLLGLLCLPAALATTYLELDFETMTTKAELAFFGTVRTVAVEERSGDPWTIVSFDVVQRFKGLEEEVLELELAFLGGALPDGTSLTVNLMPRFEAGEEVLLFAYKRTSYSPIVGFRQGLWRLGDLGFRDEADRLLTVDDEGALQLDGAGTNRELVLEALVTLFEDGP